MKALLAIYILLNGQEIEFKDAEPFIENKVLMVPLRGVFEAMGAKVKYSPRNREIDIDTADSHVHFGLVEGNIKLKTPERSADIDVAAAWHYYTYLPVVRGGRAYVPLRFVAEALGANVTWDHATRTASITTDQSPRTPGIRAGEIEIRASSDKSHYRAGEPVEFTITAINQDEQPRTLSFSSGQSFDISIVAPDGGVLWQWSHDRMFTQALRDVTLKPGETLKWSATWNQRTNEGREVPRGEYTVRVKLTAQKELHTPPLVVQLSP